MRKSFYLYNEDCLVTMSRLPDNSIDLIFADYPFKCQDGRHKKEYLNFVEETSNEFYRILRDGGNLVVVNNPFNHYKTLHLFSRKFGMRNKISLLRRAAFYTAWHFGMAHNDAYLLVKGENPITSVKVKWNGVKKGNIKFDKDFIEYQNGRHSKAGFHPQALPQDLVDRWVTYLSDEGDLVYDPFTGSGSTLIACQRLNRNFIGSEFNQKYYEMSLANANQDKEKSEARQAEASD